jgi:hypothetical protein
MPEWVSRAGHDPDTIRFVTRIRPRSVAEPLDRPETAWEAVRLLTTAEVLGLLPPTLETVEAVDLPTIRTVLKEAAAAGVGRQALAEAESRSERDARGWLEVLVHANEALAENPVPDRTWPVLAELLGVDLLARLVGVAPASARRYLTGDRATPDPVAERLHSIALVVGDLAGSYNEYGIRRWFVRPRAQLDGKAPADVLTRNWSPDDAGPRAVRALAMGLVDAMAT